MKQRLLLALLVLFASVGMVKAANDVTITPLSNTGSFKITYTGGEPTVSDAKSVSKSGNTLTIIPNGVSTITLAGNGSTNTTGYTFAGVVETIGVNVEDYVTNLAFSGTVNNLTITKAEGITTLNVSNLGLNSFSIASAAKLASLTLTGNNLNPAKTTITGTPSTLKPQWGTQTLSVSTGSSYGVTGLGAQGINLTHADFTGVGKVLEYLNGLSGTWTFNNWQKLNESNQTYVSTSEARGIPNVTGAFAFYDNGQYYTDGTYSCKVTRDGVSIILTGIQIEPAEINITIPSSDKNGWGNEVMGGIKGVTVNTTAITASSGYLTAVACKQGDKIAVVASPETNYEFTKFEVSSGLVDETHSTGTAVSTFTVKAKCMTNNPAVQDPVTLKALFKGKDCKISYNESVLNGTFYIADVNNNNQKIANNAIVEYGHRLRIQATPVNTKYYAQYKVADKEPQTANVLNTTNADFKTNKVADVFVDKDRTITVSFLTDDALTSGYTLKLQSPSDVDLKAAAWTDVVKLITLDGIDTNVAGKAKDPFTYTGTITAGKSVPISVTIADDKDYVVKSIQMGTQALNVINESKGVFTANFTAPEDNNASFTIVIVKQSAVKVYINGESLTPGTALDLTSAQKYTYDKQQHGLKYVTDPSGLTLNVLYKLSTLASDDYYTTDLPVAAGEYFVKVSRKADAYEEIAETAVTASSSGAIIIDPATITITTPPTVTAQFNSKTNEYTFVLTGGVANSLGENVTSKGTFVVLNESSPIDITDPAALEAAAPYANNLVPASFVDSYRNVAVRFMMKNDKNYKPAATRVRVSVGKPAADKDKKYKLVVNSNIVTVSGQPSSVNTVQAEVYNGATRVAYGKNTKTETTLGEGMQVYLRAIVDGYSKVNFVNMDPTAAAGEDLFETELVEGTTNTFQTKTPVILSKDYAFSVALDGKLNQVFKVQSFDRKEVTYNGEPQIYDPTANNLVIYKNGAPYGNLSTLLLSSPIYYKDETGKVVTGGAPVEAGKYDVCIDIPASVDPANPYDAQTLTASQALQILKKVPNVKWPSGVSRIGAGQRLSAAQLFTDGTSDINGTFAWEDGTITPKNGQFYTIKFTPVDTKNYEVVYLYADDQRTNTAYKDLAITVSSKPIISIDGSVLNGSFIVKSGNVEYHSGNEVNDGTTLTITAVANDGFVCKSLIIDEAGTKHTSTGETTFKVNGKSIYVTGEFELKSAFDPNTQYTVTLPKADAVRGVIIGKPGVNAVAKDGSFSFTLESLAADAKNIVVKVNGTVLAPTDKTYTIAKVDGNKTVTVALSNPTKIKVAVEQETKNAKGYLMGTVEVDGLAADSTCYYGDEVTLVAFPESGVTFTGWSGSIGSTDKLVTLTVKQTMKIQPKFKGVPTGIDTIEATSIRGMQGHIQITCQGEASVTVIGMDGTHKLIRISGDTRIPATTGIYGIILTQNGEEAIKTKVIVR